MLPQHQDLDARRGGAALPRRSPGQQRRRDGGRVLPREVEDRCLNCLSTAHRVATCRRPPRCFSCHGVNHFARDCKRPRATGGGQAPPRNDGRFVR